MDVGETLRFFREGLGLSQKDFINNLVSSSYYSKVEKNESDLGSDKLIQLLKQNNINSTEFFYQLQDGNETVFVFWYRQIRDAYYQENISDLSLLLKNIPEQDYFFKIGSLLEKSLKEESISKTEKEVITSYLSNLNRWTEYHILLFLLGTKVFSTKELLFLFGSFSKHMDDTTIYKMYEKDIILALLNIVEACLRQKYIEEAIYFLRILPQVMTSPFYLFERTMLDFYNHFVLVVTDNDVSKNIIICHQIINYFDRYNMSIIVHLLTSLMSLYGLNDPLDD